MSSTTFNLKNINFMSESKYESLSEIKDDELYAVKLNSGDLVTPDNLSITKNSSDAIQTVGVIDQADNTKAIKMWTGTKAEYDLLTPDSNTIYNITDEDVSPDNRVTHNIGDIFYSMRTEDILNGAVVCDGSTYNISDYASGDQSVRNLLRDGKLPYVSLSDYSATITSKGVCRCFGYDANGETFRVPTLTDVFIETGSASSANEKIDAGLPNITGTLLQDGLGGGSTTYTNNGVIWGTEGAFGTITSSGHDRARYTIADSGLCKDTIPFDASRSSAVYGNSTTVQPNAVKYRAYVQLATDTTDSALQTVSSVVNDVEELQDAMEETVNYKNITNCITEIPQDIKLELDNGTLTLKAGSKVYIPDGFEQDGTTPKFDVVLTTNDINYTYTTDGTYYIVYEQVSSTPGLARCIYPANSGTTQPTASTATLWYDITNNLVKRYSGSTWDNKSFPIAIITVSNNVITSINQVFNGFGYIGSTVFALPGVKGLMPNGRNEDGTLKNTELIVNNVFTRTFTLTGNYVLAISPTIISITNGYIYNEEENKNYSGSLLWGVFVIGRLNLSSGVVVDFKTNQTFHAVDYNDSSTISGWSAPSGKYINLTFGATDTNYTAPANGWFLLYAQSTSTNVWAQLVNTSKESFVARYSNNAQLDFGIYLPVNKGDIIKLQYGSVALSQSYAKFRFYYAEGEVN